MGFNDSVVEYVEKDKAFGDAFGGFWAGFYTLISTYILICTLLPWLEHQLKTRANSTHVS